MAKRKLLLMGLASSLFITTSLLPVSHSLDITSANAQQLPNRKVSLGATLNANEAQRTLQILNATDIGQADQIRIDGTRVNAYLNDGSTASTDVYSSAIIEPREAGYGVQVQILTPDTIRNVSVQTYQNAAITSGAKDVLIKIASVHPVTGEGALAGVYAIYQANGNQLNQQNIQVAQQEIKLPEQVKTKDQLTDVQINALTAKIKTIISETVQANGNITDDRIKEIIKEQADKIERDYNVVVSPDSRQIIFNIMQDFAALETQNYQDTLANSNQESWTMEQAVDLLSGALNNPNKLTEGPELPRNDALSWKEVSRQDNYTALAFGDVLYEFAKYDTSTIVSVAMTQNDQIDYYVENFEIDHNTLYLLNYTHYPILNQYDMISDADQAKYYLEKALYPSTQNQSYNLVASDANDRFWDLSPQKLNENGQEISLGTYRVWTGGLIEFLSNQELAGYPTVITPDSNTGQTPQYSVNYWDASKDQALQEFMVTWGKQMNQEYQRRTPAEPGDMYGPLFPNEMLDILAVNDVPVNAYWSTDGISYNEGDFAIVAAYEDSEDYFAKNPEHPAGAHFYLFAIVDGYPVVLHSQQNQGNELGLVYFNPTENQQLAQGFINIVNQ